MQSISNTYVASPVQILEDIVQEIEILSHRPIVEIPQIC